MQPSAYPAHLLLGWTVALGEACQTRRGEEIVEILGLDFLCEDRIEEMIDDLLQVVDDVNDDAREPGGDDQRVEISDVLELILAAWRADGIDDAEAAHWIFRLGAAAVRAADQQRERA